MSEIEAPRTPGLTVRTALELVFSRFEEVVASNPSALTTDPDKDMACTSDLPVELDTFADFAAGTHATFMRCAEAVIYDETFAMDTRSKDELHRKFHVSKLGIGVVSTVAEIAPLVAMKELPGVELSDSDAARLVTNSLGFVRTIIESGARIGPTIVSTYLKPELTDGSYWKFKGIVAGDTLVRPELLDNFKIGLDATGEAQLIPIQFETALEDWQQKAAAVPDNGITCPAHSYNPPGSSDPYTMRLAALMVDHAHEHIYPSYLPRAREVLFAHYRPSVFYR